MGAAVPIIGAGVSLIGGISSANQANAQAEAQRKAIAVQQQADQLNAQLNLLNLRNQQALNNIADLNASANEAAAFSNRMNQLALAETSNQIATSSFLAQTTANKTLSAIAASEKQAAADAEAGGTAARASQELASAFSSISEQQQRTIAEQLQNLGTNERANAIRAIMDASVSGGQNAALALLNEFVAPTTAGQERASEFASLQRDQAQAVADATTEAGFAGASLNKSKAELENASNQNQLILGEQDANAALKVNTSAFASERAATDYAFLASGKTRAVENMARDANLAASMELTERGAVLSAEAAKANAGAVRGAGFFDYLNAGASAFRTYQGLGGRPLF